MTEYSPVTRQDNIVVVSVNNFRLYVTILCVYMKKVMKSDTRFFIHCIISWTCLSTEGAQTLYFSLSCSPKASFQHCFFLE